MERYKILITANHCAPDQGSEHGVGWNFFTGISKHHDVILICNNHEYIQGLIDFVNSDEGKKRNIQLFLIRQKVKYTNRTRFFPFFYYNDYKNWEKQVYSLAKEIIQTESVDIVHHLTNITFREPGFLWKLPKPFVWGPIGILGNEPVRFFTFYSFKELIKMILRRVSCLYQLKYSKRLKEAFQQASACICVDNHAKEIITHKLGVIKTAVIPETGAIINGQNFTPSLRNEKDPIQLLWVGRLDSSKGILFLIKALIKIQKEGNVNYHLTIIGNGDQRKKAIYMCHKYNINYTYLKHAPYHKMADFYQNSHLFFLTSLMDATTSVVFEALANYCPVIALNHLSFSEIVNKTCGRKINLHTQKQISDDIAESIRFYYHREKERYQLALGARKRAEEYTWDIKIEQLNRIYQHIMAEKDGH
jgi:glycosyltransferase involved in cell wall biosynthesis